MSRQDKSKPKNDYQKKILHLEKHYFELLDEMLQSQDFISDLLIIEKEIRENYPEYNEIWALKNKIKVPVERLIRHHVYMRFNKLIEGIYPSPVSSDLGIRTKDAVICVDAKTIDTCSNAGDLRSTHVEENQNSFNNKNYPYIQTTSHLKSIDHYTRKPVLTYIIKVVYNDNNYGFGLERGTYPTIVLTCIPNGEISSLFDYNIIDNFKTYNYFTERDGDEYAPIEFPIDVDESEIETVLDGICRDKGFSKIGYDIFNKLAYFDVRRRNVWWQTKMSRKKVLAAVKSGSTVRYSNEILTYRFDDNDDMWIGYKEYRIENEL